MLSGKLAAEARSSREYKSKGVRALPCPVHRAPASHYSAPRPLPCSSAQVISDMAAEVAPRGIKPVHESVLQKLGAAGGAGGSSGGSSREGAGAAGR